MKKTAEDSQIMININRIKQTIDGDRKLILVFLLTVVIFYVSSAVLSENGLLTSGVRLSNYEAGKVAEKDIVVDRDIEYVDDKATKLKREAEALLVEPVFRVTDSITERVMSSFDKFLDIYLDLINENKSPAEIYLGIQSALPGVLTEKDIEIILGTQRPAEVLFRVREVIKSVMNFGVVSYPDNFKNSSDSIELLRWSNDEKVIETILQADSISLDNLIIQSNQFYSKSDLSEEELEVFSTVLRSFIEENAFYDSEQTKSNRDRAREQVLPVVKKMVKDEVIVKRAFIITEENMVKVEALGNFSDNLNVSIFFGRLIFIIFLAIVSYKLLRPPILLAVPAKSRLYLIMVLFSFYILTAALITRYTNHSGSLPEAVYLPTALIIMLISILINTRAGVISTIILSLSLFLLPGAQMNNFLYAFISGVFGSLIVYKAENRITLIKAGLIISLINTSLIIMLGLLNNSELSYYFDAILVSIINGFLCGVLTLGLLPILEHILNAPTAFRLMELSDLNTPLFKRMLILAPGTYSHSVSVANLAETAAKEIGANALLSRVGAYYHDIGKIDQAEYFIENQKAGNKHDDLKATLSTAVIKSHVKIGYEKAKELGLPDEVMEIIAQHHGSGKINYFYMKAMNEQKIVQKLSPEDFSYNGTPPVSREAAVVMLADTVEAATRTLKNPTMAKLDRFSWELIMEKVSSGQMRNSGLTFNDLEIIKNTFVQILGGSFHKRIEYPGQKEGEDE
ncbi:MAG: HDIG domain-containing protein [Spirochaetales bacterium]|nr:HDIG domain-containing protein [Spirochaetales bacterium]